MISAIELKPCKVLSLICRNSAWFPRDLTGLFTYTHTKQRFGSIAFIRWIEQKSRREEEKREWIAEILFLSHAFLLDHPMGLDPLDTESLKIWWNLKSRSCIFINNASNIKISRIERKRYAREQSIYFYNLTDPNPWDIYIYTQRHNFIFIQ